MDPASAHLAPLIFALIAVLTSGARLSRSARREAESSPVVIAGLDPAIQRGAGIFLDSRVKPANDSTEVSCRSPSPCARHRLLLTGRAAGGGSARRGRRAVAACRAGPASWATDPASMHLRGPVSSRRVGRSTQIWCVAAGWPLDVVASGFPVREPPGRGSPPPTPRRGARSPRAGPRSGGRR